MIPDSLWNPDVSSIKHMTIRKGNFSLTVSSPAMLPGTCRAPIRPFLLFFLSSPRYSWHVFIPFPVSWCCYSGYHVCLKSCARCLWPRCMKRLTAWGGKNGGPGWDVALDGWMGRRKAQRMLDPPLRAALSGADSLNLLFLLTPATHFHS